MANEKITVMATAAVLGPGGAKLAVGKVYVFDDSPYVRILIKSGDVELVDPPSLSYIDDLKTERPMIGFTPIPNIPSFEEPVVEVPIEEPPVLEEIKPKRIKRSSKYSSFKEVEKEELNDNAEEQGTETDEEV